MHRCQLCVQHASYFSASKIGTRAAEFYELLTAPAAKVLDRWLESEPLKATLATDSVIGAMTSPQLPGSGYVRGVGTHYEETNFGPGVLQNIYIKSVLVINQGFYSKRHPNSNYCRKFYHHSQSHTNQTGHKFCRFFLIETV